MTATITAQDLYRALDERIPRSLSCEWDNDGVMCLPDPARPVRRVLIALDVTDRVIDAAIERGCDVILSHHPLVFHGLKHLTPEDPVVAKCIRLCSSGLAVFSFHTRLDAAVGGVNDTLAEMLGLTDVLPFSHEGVPIGRIGTAPEEYEKACDFASFVAHRLGAPGVFLADAGRPVHRVAVLGGSGSDCIEAALQAGADTYVTGEAAHHHMVGAPEQGFNLIAAGHFYTEHPVCTALQDMLHRIAPDLDIEVFNSNTTLTIHS